MDNERMSKEEFINETECRLEEAKRQLEIDEKEYYAALGKYTHIRDVCRALESLLTSEKKELKMEAHAADECS